jgi:signal transduction histidine kinase
VSWIRDRLRAEWWVLLLVVTVAGTLGRWHESQSAWAAVLAGLAVLALLLRHRDPGLTWLGNAAAVTLYFGLGYGDGPVYLSIVASAYAVTSRWPVRRWWPYAGAVVPIVVVRVLRWSDASVGSVSGRITWFLAVLAAAAAIGAAMRTRGETRREQARRTATEERLRMAQDLHDGVGHGLAVIAMQAGVALHVLERDQAGARESLLAIRETSRESLDALRAELSRLSTDPAEAAPRMVRNGLDDLPGLVARVRAGGLQVELTTRYDAVPDQVAEAAYRVVQEALTNVLRHSGAGLARVEVVSDAGSLLVTVVDDGQGGPVQEGLGLQGMRARVERLGGALRVGPVARGFEVRATIPVADGAAA